MRGGDMMATTTRYRKRGSGWNSREFKGPGPEVDFIFAALAPCFCKISAARRGST